LQGGHKGVLNRFAWLDELQLNMILAGPLVKHVAGKLGGIIGENCAWQAAARAQSRQHPLYPLAGERYVDLDRRTLPAPLVNQCERGIVRHSQGVVNEVHRLDLVDAGRQ